MLPASKALRRASVTGHRLPEVDAFGGLYAAGVTFRAGQLVMWTGRPKAGKSNAVQYLCHHMGLPTLYFALDMDPFTAAVRHAALVTNHRQAAISSQIEGPGEAFYEDALADTKITYCFDTAPSLADIMAEIEAWVEVYDSYPEVIAVDNLLNIDVGEGGHQDYKFALRELQKLARLTGASVHVMHHALENTKDPAKPPAARDTDNKVNQIPEMVLSVAKDPESDRFLIAHALVRNGKSDPEGMHPTVLFADFDRMVFSRYRPAPNDWREQ